MKVTYRLSVGADHMLSEKSQWTQNGTMFVDLDWPLNASSPLSASAELLVTYGIRGIAYNWIESYLSDRSQYVYVNNVSSRHLPVRCGVPQGQGRTGPPGCLALARWAGWSAGQVGRHVKCWSRSNEKYSGSFLAGLTRATPCRRHDWLLIQLHYYF